MAQEFTIKSEAIESKINQLLPTQGGFQPGVDFSASTMVIPIVDLTETAEGSNVRADLQTAFTLTNATAYNIANSSSTVFNTPGFYRLLGTISSNRNSGSGTQKAEIQITDGITTKTIYGIEHQFGSSATFTDTQFDFVIKIGAGESIVIVSNENDTRIFGSGRQIADVNGNLVNP